MAGVGPLLAWRRVTRRPAARLFAAPAAVAARGDRRGARLQRRRLEPDLRPAVRVRRVHDRGRGPEYLRAVRARRLVASRAAAGGPGGGGARNRRRYGGYLVHIGVAVALLGIAASSASTPSATCGSVPATQPRSAGYDRPLRAAHVRPLERADRLRRRARRPQGRQGRRHAARRPATTTPPRSPMAGPAGPLLPGASRPARWASRRAGQRLVDRDAARSLRCSNRRSARQPIARDSAGRRRRPDDRAPSRSATSGRSAARHLPADRQPDGDLDLDRRPDRARRRRLPRRLALGGGAPRAPRPPTRRGSGAS